MFMPFIFQGVCTNEDENTVVSLCEASISTGGCGPFTKYQPPQIGLQLSQSRPALPSTLVFLPVASSMACPSLVPGLPRFLYFGLRSV